MAHPRRSPGTTQPDDTALGAVSKLGLLPSKRWSTVGAYFDRQVLVNFLRRFRIARREAVLNSIDVHTAWAQILDDDGTSLLTRLGNGHLIGLARIRKRHQRPWIGPLVSDPR